jgi:mannose-6-phosphate isomerase-like protein (cupin superfamily)
MHSAEYPYQHPAGMQKLIFIHSAIKQDKEDCMSTLTHFPASDGQPMLRGGFGTMFKVNNEASRGSVTVVAHTLAPGLLGEPPHRHTHEDETSCVLSGELTVRIGDETVTVGPGDIILKPRNMFHTFWNAGSETVRFIEIITPGGFETYVEELAKHIPRDGPPDMQAIVALAARYGIEFDFATLPALTAEREVQPGD